MTIDQLNKLTDEEVIVRVALALGWTMHPRPGAVKCSSAIPKYEAILWENKFVSPQFNGNEHYWCPLFNYPHDLNACGEFEQNLAANEAQFCKYKIKLERICADDFWEHHTHWSDDPIFASAKQRCVAFLAVTEREEG